MMLHQITVTPSDTVFTAQEDETLLRAALRQGHRLPHACQSGVCGSCKARLIAGEVVKGEYDDYVLNDDEKQSGMFLLCCSHPRSDVAIDMPTYGGSKALPIRTLPARIAALEHRHDVAIVTVALPKAPPFRFYAGQYMDVLLQEGNRSYSIANAPEYGQSLVFHVRYRAGGLFSEQLFDGRLKAGDIIRLRGPFGSFGLNENSVLPLIFLATGTGFAPVMGLLQHLRYTDVQRSVHVYHGGRVQADLYDEAALLALMQDLPNARYTPVLSGADGTWYGARGHVQDQVLGDYADLSGHEVYACGAAAMIDGARRVLTEQAKLPEQAFFSDVFFAYS